MREEMRIKSRTARQSDRCIARTASTTFTLNSIGAGANDHRSTHPYNHSRKERRGMREVAHWATDKQAPKYTALSHLPFRQCVLLLMYRARTGDGLRPAPTIRPETISARSRLRIRRQRDDPRMENGAPSSPLSVHRRLVDPAWE